MAIALPRQGPPRDFAPIPEDLDREFARDENELSPASQPGNSAQEANSKLKYVLAGSQAKEDLEQSGVPVQGSPEQ